MGCRGGSAGKSLPLLSVISVSAVNRDQIKVRLAACDQWWSCTQLQHAADPTSSDHTCEQNINAIVSARVRGLVKAVCSRRYSSLVNRNTKDICTSDDGHTWHSQWFKHPALEHFLLISIINKYCPNVCLFFRYIKMQWFLIFPGPSSDLRCFLKILFLSLIEHGEQFNLAPSQECWLGYYSDVERSAAFSCTPCRTQTVRSYSLSKDSSFPRNAGSQKQKLTNIAVFFFCCIIAACLI